MFRTRPYWGWLTMTMLLWGLAVYQNARHHRKLQPAVMAAEVQDLLQARDAELRKFLKDTGSIRQILNNRVPDKLHDEVWKLSFYLFAYHGDSLVYWNDDDLLSPADEVTDTIGQLILVNNQYCIRKTFTYPGNQRLVALLPIKFSYPFENQYLQSHFDNLAHIPAATEVLGAPEPTAYPVKDKNGHLWLSLKFPKASDSTIAPDNETLIWSVLAMAVSLLWLQLLILYISRKKSIRLGILLTLLLVAGLWLLPRLLPLPFALNELGVFSPAIYAYSWLLSSLGQLLMNEIALLWVVIFLLTETPYYHYWKNLRVKALRSIAAALIICCFPIVLYQVWVVLYSLVLDSQISFDVSHFHNIDGYTILGLLTIGLALIILETVTRLLRAQVYQLIPQFWLRQSMVTGVSVLFVWLFHRELPMLYMLIFWMTAYMCLLEIRRNAVVSMLSLQMIFLSLFTSASITVILHDLIRMRDLGKDRIAYAEHLLASQDPLMEYNFKSIPPRLQQDEHLLNFLKNPTLDQKILLARKLNILYFNILTNRYQPEFYFFNRSGVGLANIDTVGLAQLNNRFTQGMPTDEDHLVFSEGPAGNNYLARIPLGKEDSADGYLFINLALKKNINETVYPELLQPGTINRIEKEASYAYALYAKGVRITQTSNYNFPAVIPAVGNKPQTKIRKVKSGYYELLHSEGDDNVVIVAGSTGSWMSAAILLSYLFGMHLLLSLFALLYRWWLRIWMRDRIMVYHLTMQQRIHFGTLIILLISFVVVGIVTVAFFNERYTQTNRIAMHQTTQSAERTIRQYLASQGAIASRFALDSVARTPEFRYMLYTFAASQKIDANVFSYGGRLLVASQEDLYEQGLLAPVIRPNAFRQLRAGSNIVEENEIVGDFPFLSCCIALRNDEGAILGYISVPFFSYQKELDDQVSNIVVALVNLYAVLFFLSSFLAWFISTRLTRAFNVLINQFGRLNLQKNELLQWPYNDEIGTLVAEYNKMALKVEEQASLLAQDERESAWREMARQVAHEIKNPLTPMKLNIQYLQQALQSKRPDVEVLAARVSASIIEQIDNLSYIASEFSNFAKMPEAKPEVFALNELLQRAIPLYQGKGNVAVVLELPQILLYVLADYSQLLRVFTNLMQNAMQAIPDKASQGKILVTLQWDNDTALLVVKDNGVGIDQETAGKIFKPYFTTKSSGTGLGLAMSRKIIELWKGAIWFESIPGEGTTFFIQMPIETHRADQETAS